MRIGTGSVTGLHYEKYGRLGTVPCEGDCNAEQGGLQGAAAAGRSAAAFSSSFSRHASKPDEGQVEVPAVHELDLGGVVGPVRHRVVAPPLVLPEDDALASVLRRAGPAEELQQLVLARPHDQLAELLTRVLCRL